MKYLNRNFFTQSFAPLHLSMYRSESREHPFGTLQLELLISITIDSKPEMVESAGGL